MKKRDLDYMLCAIWYCMWRMQINRERGFSIFLYNCILYLQLPLVRNKHKVLKRWVKNRDRIERQWNGRVSPEGYAVRYRLDVFSLGYYIGIIAIIQGFVIGIIQYDNDSFSIISSFLILACLSLYVDWKIYWKKGYLVYFRIFEHKNFQWYEKWRNLTYVFILGSLLSLFAGILFFFFLASLNKEEFNKM